MRLFLAVDLDDEARRAAARCIEELRRSLDSAAPRLRIKWVDPAALHVTLRFLGEVDLDRAREVEQLLTEPFRVPPFPVALGGPGLFPPAGAPRIIWLAIADGAAELAALAEQLEARLARAGFDRADREFRAHLTLGRVREAPGRTGDALRSAVTRLTRVPPTRWTIDHVTLYESRLSPRGPEYISRVTRALEAT